MQVFVSDTFFKMGYFNFTATIQWFIPKVALKSVPCYLEVKDDGPYQPQGQLGVSICNVVVSDVDQFDLKGAWIPLQLNGEFLV